MLQFHHLLDLTKDLYPSFVLCYWIGAGLVTKALFESALSFSMEASVPQSPAQKTVLVRKIFYFATGGFLLPLLLLFLFPLGGLAWGAQLWEQRKKDQEKN